MLNRTPGLRPRGLLPSATRHPAQAPIGRRPEGETGGARRRGGTPGSPRGPLSSRCWPPVHEAVGKNLSAPRCRTRPRKTSPDSLRAPAREPGHRPPQRWRSGNRIGGTDTASLPLVSSVRLAPSYPYDPAQFSSRPRSLRGRPAPERAPPLPVQGRAASGVLSWNRRRADTRRYPRPGRRSPTNALAAIRPSVSIAESTRGGSRTASPGGRVRPTRLPPEIRDGPGVPHPLPGYVLHLEGGSEVQPERETAELKASPLAHSSAARTAGDAHRSIDHSPNTHTRASASPPWNEHSRFPAREPCGYFSAESREALLDLCPKSNRLD